MIHRVNHKFSAEVKANTKSYGPLKISPQTGGSEGNITRIFYSFHVFQSFHNEYILL